MADAVTSQTLREDDRKLVMKFTNTSDGTGEAAVTKVDVSTFTNKSGGSTMTAVTLDRIIYTTNGMGVRILWDATADVTAYELPNSGDGDVSFEHLGGIKNNAGSGKTGDVQFTTVGHTAGDSYVVILEMSKSYS